MTAMRCGYLDPRMYVIRYRRRLADTSIPPASSKAASSRVMLAASVMGSPGCSAFEVGVTISFSPSKLMLPSMSPGTEPWF